jgi:tetratricopeptide (TPR) repeat protein
MNHDDTIASKHGSGPKRPRRKLWLLLGTCLVAAVVIGGLALGRYWLSRSYAEACRQAERDQDWKRLEALAAKWTFWHGSKAEPWIFLAQAAQEQGDLQRAVAFLDRAPPSDPLTPAAWLEQSTLLFGPLNRPIQGAESCERALAINPRLPEAYRRVIYFYTYTLQRRKMVRRVYDAIANDCDQPEIYLYLVAQDYLSLGDAYDQTTKWLKGAPDNELLVVAQAHAGIKSGAFGQVPEQPLEADGRLAPVHRQVVDKLFARFPRNLELLVYYLQSSSADGDADQVAKVLSSAPHEAVEDGRFWRYKGWLHNVRGELLEAESAYRKALEINPYDSLSHQQWAAVERRLNRKSHAETLLLLAKEGQELRQIILHLPDVAVVDRTLLERIAKYAASCGDNVVANKLYERMGNP